MRNISEKFIEKITTSILCSVPFLDKSCHLCGNVKTFDKNRQATGGNIIRHMRNTCWISNTTGTPSEYVIQTAFHGNKSYAKAPQCYVYTYIARLVYNTHTQVIFVTRVINFEFCRTIFVSCETVLVAIFACLDQLDI
jgi:hypothetical protein